MNRKQIVAAMTAAVLTFSAVPAQTFAEEYSVSREFAAKKLEAPSNIKQAPRLTAALPSAGRKSAKPTDTKYTKKRSSSSIGQ